MNKMLNKKKKRIIKYKYELIFIIMLAFGQSASATPSITGVSGTYTNGQTITITGTNLYDTSGNSKQNAGPMISSYDNATSGNNWHSGSIGGSWQQAGGQDASLSTSSPRSALYQSDHKVGYNSNGDYSAMRFDDNTMDDKIYVSWWHFRDYSSYSTSSPNTKFIRIYQSTEADDNSASLMMSVDHVGGSCDANTTYFAPEHAPASTGWTLSGISGASITSYTPFTVCLNTAIGPQFQQWEHWELYMDYPSSLTEHDGNFTIWKNGQRLARGSNVSTAETGNYNNARMILIGQVSGGITGNEYLDQIYIDRTIAHVFISSDPNVIWPDYATAHHNEIQVISVWSPTQIQFTLNQGSFGSSDTVYLYVVDSSGNISSPQTIKLGGSGTSDTTSPVAPTGLSVS